MQSEVSVDVRAILHDSIAKRKRKNPKTSKPPMAKISDDVQLFVFDIFDCNFC